MLMVGHILQLEGYEALREAFPIPTIEVVYYIQKPVEEDLARRLKHSRLPATEVDNQHVTNIDNRRPKLYSGTTTFYRYNFKEFQEKYNWFANSVGYNLESVRNGF